MQACRPWKIIITSHTVSWGEPSKKLVSELFYGTHEDAKYSANWFKRCCTSLINASDPILDHNAALKNERRMLRITVNEIISEKLLTKGT